MSDDLISRQAAINAIHDEREWLDANIQSAQHHAHMMNETARILGIIGNLLAVQPKQKTGRWINDKHDIPRCSCCSYIPEYSVHIGDYYYSDYCPDCGAKMEGDNNDS